MPLVLASVDCFFILPVQLGKETRIFITKKSVSNFYFLILIIVKARRMIGPGNFIELFEIALEDF